MKQRRGRRSKHESLTKPASLAVKYSNQPIIRAVIQAIPYVGGSADTLLGSVGDRYRRERLDELFSGIAHRLEVLEDRLPSNVPSVPSEELSDLVSIAAQGAASSRSELRRDCFANLVTRQLLEIRPWDEAEAAARLLADLSELHLRILEIAITARPGTGVFGGTPVISLDESTRSSAAASSVLTRDIMGVNPLAPRLACASLVSNGLLHDEGIGRVSTPAMHYFVATEEARWLQRWITDPTTGGQGPTEPPV